MTDQPGLFALPDPPEPQPAPQQARRDRGRRGERWTRTVVADLQVTDAHALREAAHERLSTEVDPHEEIDTSDASAVQWWIEPTAGVWPELAEALRVDAVDLEATDAGPGRVRATWSVAVTISDVRELRSHNRPPTGTGDESFAEVWNRAADPVAPLVGLPGVTWTPVTVDVARTRR